MVHGWVRRKSSKLLLLPLPPLTTPCLGFHNSTWCVHALSLSLYYCRLLHLALMELCSLHVVWSKIVTLVLREYTVALTISTSTAGMNNLNWNGNPKNLTLKSIPFRVCLKLDSKLHRGLVRSLCSSLQQHPDTSTR